MPILKLSPYNSLLENMRPLYTGILGLLVALQACSLNRPNMALRAAISQTPEEYKAERSEFIDLQNSRAKRNDPQTPQNSFDRFTAAGLLVGLAGGIYAAVVNTDKHWGAVQVKSVSGIASALSGVITGWIGYKHYERTIPDAEKCQKAVNDALTTFRLDHPESDTPTGAAAWAAFRKEKVDLNASVAAACPR